MVLKIVKTVWPVMLTYVAIGAPCGMIMAQTGMEPWMVFALSSTFVTGSGQFMVCNLWLAGVPAASIVASVAAISSRFALYSASIAPHLRDASKRQTLAVAATLTEEAYGISLARLVEGAGLGPARVLCAQRDPHRNMGAFRVRRAPSSAPSSMSPPLLAGFWSAPRSLSACSFRSDCRAAMSWLPLWPRCPLPYASSWGGRISPCRQACSSALPRRLRAMLSPKEGALAMPVNEFLVLWLSSWAAIAFSALPRRLPCAGERCRPALPRPWVIFRPPPFAALVANDLISPGAFDAGLWRGLILWIAAAGVVAVAIKTKSMLWCCVSGIVLYIVLSLVLKAKGALTVPVDESNFSPSRSASSGTMVKLYCSKA